MPLKRRGRASRTKTTPGSGIQRLPAREKSLPFCSPIKQQTIRANTGGKAMKVFAATLTLLVSSAAAAQECQTCSMADACITTYLKAASQAQKATKQAIRDWKQNLDKKASAELSSRGTLALQDAMETQVRLELERLKECLANTK